MAVLSDHIEQFIQQMMEEYEGILELQRNELAQYFNCAPSQINYVLATRFTPERGYVIESRRGGGGYIRLQRVKVDEQEHLMALITQRLATGRISLRDGEALVRNLRKQKLLGAEEERLMRAAISDKALTVPGGVKDVLRASVLKQMLIALLIRGEDDAVQ